MAAERVRVIPAEISHVYALAATLRFEDAAELESVGLGCREGLRSTFRAALTRHTAIVDGQVAAMWGMGGDALGDIGVPWLLTAPIVERVPVAFIKIGREHVARMLGVKPILRNHVAASYHRACRMLEVLGFELGAPEPFGPYGAPFRPFEMRR